jgi:maltose/moltooligosaccharide transporter
MDSCENRCKYTIGTLSYTRMGVFVLFMWMLWGWFCYMMMEFLIPKVLPITLRSIGASNTLIGVIVGTLPAVLSVLIVPVISLRSDRHRGKMGRRIPYMLYSAPFIAAFLVLVGWGPQIGQWLHSIFLSDSHGITSGAIILGVVVVASVLFQLFNLFVSSVYFYLFADVVPEKLLGRFMGLLNVVGAAAGFIFSRYIFIYAESHAGLVYTGVSIVYLIAMILLCYNVKEGEYPPPKAQENPGLVTLIKTYWNECYTKPYYLMFFAGTAISAMSLVCRNIFTVFFGRENIGLSMEEFGTLFAWFSLLTAGLAYPCGWLVDKLKPIRAYNIALVLVVACSALSFFLIHDKTTFIIYTLATSVSYALQRASTLPMFAELLPKDRYGQFCAAQALVNSLVLILANMGGGMFIDIMGDYRYLYVWDAIFTAVALVFMVMVYKRWRMYGGARSYIAPE